ncbi:MAG: hypothetical protein E6J14_13935 [Chloroflexi bacterium]|nr:MAG: hypothetical protein E6J14_13935 [Chloroflexota bacterium]
MQAVQLWRGHVVVTRAIMLVALAGALILAGLGGYLVKGSTTFITQTTVSAPAPAHTGGQQVVPYGEHFSAPPPAPAQRDRGDNHLQ